MASKLTKEQAAGFAERVDIDLDAGVCVLCLSFVSMALDRGEPRTIAAEVRRVTRDLWADGLAGPAIAAVRLARDQGVAHGEQALADLEQHGGNSVVARAIVTKLAEELSRRVRRSMSVEALARNRLPLAAPELN